MKMSQSAKFIHCVCLVHHFGTKFWEPSMQMSLVSLIVPSSFIATKLLEQQGQQMSLTTVQTVSQPLQRIPWPLTHHDSTTTKSPSCSTPPRERVAEEFWVTLVATLTRRAHVTLNSRLGFRPTIRRRSSTYS